MWMVALRMHKNVLDEGEIKVHFQAKAKYTSRGEHTACMMRNFELDSMLEKWGKLVSEIKAESKVMVKSWRELGLHLAGNMDPPKIIWIREYVLEDFGSSMENELVWREKKERYQLENYFGQDMTNF